VSGLDCGYPLSVEARYQVRDGITGLAPRRPRRLGVGASFGYREQRLGTSYVRGGLGIGPAKPLQLITFLLCQRA
jgi:hypothetical protein